jgi:hypothetical protein
MLGHVLPQYLVDARLPALAFVPVGFQHVRVNAQRLVDLAVFLRWASPAAAKQFLGCLLPDMLGEYLGGGPRLGAPRVFLKT